MFELTLILAIYLLFIFYWRRRQMVHERRLQAYKVRIHVNGIRGKSTVTRLVAGVLREAGYRTLAKTTGSAAVTIDFDGQDTPIKRRGAANVKEQQDIIAQWEPLEAEAMVVECMALQPKYQEWTENMVLQAHIGIITNVREDHQDVMGETLPEIAASLARMCPAQGYLITAEYEPALQAILRRQAQKRDTTLIVADPTLVQDEDLAAFDYLSFKDNIAIGLAVADLLGIDHAIAMRGMTKAQADIGAVRLQQVSLHQKPVIWANLFAVNDRESMIINMQVLNTHCDPQTIKIGILNNRYDRERRAEQFSDVAVHDLSFDWLITFGAYEDLVTSRLISNGFPQQRIINLGFSVNPTMTQITETIAALIPEEHQALLVGFVNIHTPQAEMLMEYFAHTPTTPTLPPPPTNQEIGYIRQRQFEIAHT